LSNGNRREKKGRSGERHVKEGEKENKESGTWRRDDFASSRNEKLGPGGRTGGSRYGKKKSTKKPPRIFYAELESLGVEGELSRGAKPCGDVLAIN